MKRRESRFEVIVVGARCAGAAVGALLARRGVDVAVVEQTRFPRDTLSSHVFQADALSYLDSLGLTTRLRATGAPFVNRTDTRVEDVRIETDWPRQAGDPGGAMSVRRFVLDPILADAASSAGAEMLTGARVVDLIDDGGRIVGVQVDEESRRSKIRARLVVGADGRRSTVARLAGARKYNVTANQRANYWRYYEGAHIDEPVFVSHRWGERFVLGIPTDGGLYQVLTWPGFADLERHHGDLETLIAEQVRGCEPIERAIAGARPVDKIRGARRWQGFFREAVGPGWVLVGDAGHFKDPGPGRGIGDAFIQAQALAAAIAPCLGEPASRLDEAMGRWAQWRDRAFADHYWFAADTSAAGTVPAVLPELLRRLDDSGRIADFFDIFNHRRRPSEVFSARRVLSAAVHAAARQPGLRRAVLTEAARLSADDLRRRRLNRRPIHADEFRRAHGTTQVFVAQVEGAG